MKLFEKSLFIHKIVALKYGYEIEIKKSFLHESVASAHRQEIESKNEKHLIFDDFLKKNKQSSLEEIVSYGKSLFQTTCDADEDIVLYRYTYFIENGNYIDCGANHPINYNVTKIFYDKGWRGINIEPVEKLICQYEAVRSGDINLSCCVSDKDTIMTFYESLDGASGLSSLEESHKAHVNSVKGWEDIQFVEYNVECKTLNSILKRYPLQNIIFLKIDVEGHEKNVLQGVDLEKYKPWIIMLEHNPNLHECENILENNGYVSLASYKHNRFYILNEKKDYIFERI
ncbi:FkbM family methyltransferase [Desulfosarcina sp. OttesenSCG-928-B08]|nr:FkbM family methyltransferase [Desulfosarcina sp. OttesenSCG-928-B08]